jgi:hypothetical protein
MITSKHKFSERRYEWEILNKESCDTKNAHSVIKPVIKANHMLHYFRLGGVNH